MSKVIDLVNEAIKMLGREELYAELTDVEKYKKVTGITWITEEMLVDESLEDKLCWLVPGGAAFCDGKTCKVMSEEEVKEFLASLSEGGDFKVAANMTTTTITLSDKETALDLGGNTITTVREESDEYGDGVTVPAGGKATISGGKIDNLSSGPAGAAIMIKDNADVTIEDIEAISNGFPVYVNGTGKATIKSGNFKAANTTAAVYVAKEGGKVVIEGGRFESMDYNGKNFCLNLNDKVAADGGKHIEVRGGEFVNFDPMHSDAEPGGDYNLVADGYVSGYYVSGNDKIYIVVEDPGNLPDMSVVDGKEVYWSATRLGNNAGVEPTVDAEDETPVVEEAPVVEDTVEVAAE